MISKTFMVARWEYIEKIKSKIFIFSVVIMPLITVVFSIVPSLLAMKEDTESRTIGIIDQSGQVTEDLKFSLEERYKLKSGKPNYTLLPIEYNGDVDYSKKYADKLIIGEQIEGCLIVTNNIMSDTVFEYRSQNVGNIKLTERLNRSLREVIIDKKLRNKGLDPSIANILKTSTDIKGIKLTKDGKESEAGFGDVLITSYAFMMMMFFLLITSGQLLVRSMLEEKSNRVVEMLLSSCSSSELMSGKILGLSLLGLTQMTLWVLMGIVAAIKLGTIPIALDHTMIIIVYFVLGYLFYSAIFVAIGAPISTEQEAQLVTSLLTLFLLVPILFAFPVLESPNSAYAKVLSFIPLTTPTMMALRIPIQMPPVWELVATSVVLLLSALGMMWAAGKIFRTTILLTGKRPGLKELIQIVKAG
ncbi:MAG: ABC transporter permease [Bacteroidetes bacterium]|nr:MAG: ABC transporter permease [Bacteroidota bacterium]